MSIETSRLSSGEEVMAGEKVAWIEARIGCLLLAYCEVFQRGVRGDGGFFNECDVRAGRTGFEHVA